MKEKRLRVYSTSICLVLAFLIIFLAGIIISRNINYNRIREEKVLGYKLTNTGTYTIDSNSEYGSRDNIISSTINKINLKFNYKLDAADNVNTKTKYTITSRLVVDYAKDISKTNIIDESKEVLSRSIDNHTGTISIEEYVVNDYVYYTNYLSKLKNDYPVAGLDARIIYTFKVNTEGSYKGLDLIDNSESSITITLLNNITNISAKNINNDSRGIYVEKELPLVNNVVTLILGIIIFIIGIIFLIPLFMAIKLVNINNEFRRTINHYLKIYDDVVVEAESPIEIIDREIIEVKSFYELLDAYQELHIPVVFFEVESNKEAWFTISTDTQIWRYILKNKNLS